MKPLIAAKVKKLVPIDPPASDRLHFSLSRDLKHFIIRPFALVQQQDGPWKERLGSWKTDYLMRSFPERQQVGQSWKVGATDNSAEVIYHCWPANQIIWEPAAQIKYQYLVANRLRQGINAANIARYQKYKILPVNDHDQSKRFPLGKYQELALCNSYDAEGYALFMEQGTGKTAIVVARLMNESKQHRKRTGKPYFCIVVCPKQLRLNWVLEIRKFATTKGRVTRLSGTPLDRMKLLVEAVKVQPSDDFIVVVVSYETMRQTQMLRAMHWDLCVADESHYGKTPSAKRTQALLGLRDVSRQRMALTATPVTNTIFDLYAQLEFLGEGWSGFSSFNAFKNFYGVYEVQGAGFNKVVGIQNLPFMQERLARISYIAKKKEVLPDLPDKTYNVLEVEMSAEQKSVYDSVATTLLHEIESDLVGEKPKQLVAQNVLTKLLRLTQITSGFVVYDAVYNEDGVEVRPRQVDRFDPNPKLELLVEILKDKSAIDKTIAWACFRQDIQSIAARLTLEGLDHVVFYGSTSDKAREKAVQRFNEDPRCKIFLGNPAAGGTGLTLLGYPPESKHTELYDTNASQVIYYSQNWSMPFRSHSEDRPYRRGTRVHVQITDLMIAGTIDEEIRKAVTDKRESADIVTDVSQILCNIFGRKVA